MGKIVDISEVLLHLGLSSSSTEEERAIVSTAITRAESAVAKYIKYNPVQMERTEYYPLGDFGYPAKQEIWGVQGTKAVRMQKPYVSVDELQVKHIPIRSIASIFVDYNGKAGAAPGAFGVDKEVEGVDYWPNNDAIDSNGNHVCRDGIIRGTSAWPTNPGSIKITYTAGYSEQELHGKDDVIDASAISEVVVDEAIRKVNKAFVWMKKPGTGFSAGPFVSEKLGDYSYNIDASLMKSMFGNSWHITSESRLKLDEFINWGFLVV